MSKLTEAEVARAVEDIRTRHWPHNSVLAMKNHDGRVGCIFRTYDGGAETIVPTIVIPSPGDEIAYASLRALVEAGWVAG